MYNYSLPEKLKGAVINHIENGENGIQPAIFITLGNSSEQYIITISNSHKFCIIRMDN